ncbi:MAG: 2TM domain-containing protein [Flavobacteriaceae bacterium]
MDENSRKYLEAKARVDEIKGFYTNLIAYCCVIPFLIFINYMTYWGFKWFWFPMIGWGISVVIHAFFTFGMGRGWEERQIKKLMEDENF